MEFIRKIKTHFIFNNFFRKSCRSWGNVQKYGPARQATEDKKRGRKNVWFSCCMTTARVQTILFDGNSDCGKTSECFCSYIAYFAYKASVCVQSYRKPQDLRKKTVLGTTLCYIRFIFSVWNYFLRDKNVASCTFGARREALWIRCSIMTKVWLLKVSIKIEGYKILWQSFKQLSNRYMQIGQTDTNKSVLRTFVASEPTIYYFMKVFLL
jgi:hypothetical protein